MGALSHAKAKQAPKSAVRLRATRSVHPHQERGISKRMKEEVAPPAEFPTVRHQHQTVKVTIGLVVCIKEVDAFGVEIDIEGGPRHSKVDPPISRRPGGSQKWGCCE